MPLIDSKQLINDVSVFTTALAAFALAAPQDIPSFASSGIPTPTSAALPIATPKGLGRDDPTYNYDMYFALVSDISSATYYDDEYHLVGCDSNGDSDHKQAPEEVRMPKLPDDSEVYGIELFMEGNCTLQVWCHDEDINNVNYRTITDVATLGGPVHPVVNNITVPQDFYPVCEDESQWVSQIRAECECKDTEAYQAWLESTGRAGLYAVEDLSV